MKFFVKYVIVAAVASAATYFGAPYLKPYLAKYLPSEQSGDAAPSVPDSADLASSVDSGASGEAPALAVPPQAPAPATPSVPRIASPGIPRQASAPAEPSAADAPARPASASAPASQPEGPIASTDKIPQSAASGAVVAWGIAVCDADVALTGGRKARIAAGTLVEETATVGEGDDEASVCSVWSDGRWNGPARVAVTDLFRVPGTREDVDSEIVELLARFYRVKNEVAGLEKKAVDPARAAIDANPYAEEYRRLYREQQAFQDKAKRLTDERDQATGSKRIQIADQLRAMQHEGRELDNKIKAIDAKYKAWKKAHANDPAITAQADDPRLESLRAELSELSAKVAPFGAR